MVTGDAIHGQAKFAEQVSKVIVSTLTVVLDQITSYDDDVSEPVAAAIMFEHGQQRRVRHGIAEASVCVGKQMRVRQVQNPKQGQGSLVPVVLWFKRPFFFDADVLGLLVG